MRGTRTADYMVYGQQTFLYSKELTLYTKSVIFRTPKLQIHLALKSHDLSFESRGPLRSFYCPFIVRKPNKTKK